MRQFDLMSKYTFRTFDFSIAMIDMTVYIMYIFKFIIFVATLFMNITFYCSYSMINSIHIMILITLMKTLKDELMVREEDRKIDM